MDEKVVVREIKSNNNNSTVRNVLDGSDDTFWMSNGSTGVEIEMAYEGSTESITVDFQKGFQPKSIKIVDCSSSNSNNEILLSKSDAKVKVLLKSLILNQPQNNSLNSIIFQFGDTYDLYGRICIYNIVFE